MQEEINNVAYELYEKRGKINGHDLGGWLQAERTVMTRYQKRTEVETKPRIRRAKSSSRRKFINE